MTNRRSKSGDAPERSETDLSRRAFVSAAVLTGFAAARPAPLSGARGTTAWRGASNQDHPLIINMLGGIGNPNLRLSATEDEAAGLRDSVNQDTSMNERALADLRASGTAGINVTVGYVAGPADPFELSVAEIARWNQVIQRYPDHLLDVRTSEDLLEAHRTGRTGIILGFQNAAMMGDDASRVRTFAGLGVRIIQLTYNVANQLGHGSMVPENGGLTDFGREVVAALNETQVVIDLSHSGERTCLDAIEASTTPICISHTGCRAVTDLPRNKTDEELRLVAESGGFVGIYFMPFLHPDGFAMAEDVVRHVEHALQVCGEDHVGIGTDGGTTQVDDLEAYKAVIAKEVEARQAAGIAAQGEKPGVVPFIPDLQGPDQFRILAQMLESRGHSTGLIEKVLGRNALRYLRDTWGS